MISMSGPKLLEPVLPYLPLTAYLRPINVVVKLAVIFTLLAGLLPLMLHLFTDYQLFVRLGPGGTPTTLTGYLRVKLLSLFALGDPYQPPVVPQQLQDSSGYLGGRLPCRSLSRPETRGIAPHRQITQKASPATFEALSTCINQLGQNSDKLACRTSCFEKHAAGLFSISPVKRTCGGEICHAHPSDGSLHLTLHPVDAAVVLNAAWGERHPLARGGWFERFVPGGFIMVYAPRDAEEIEVVMKIVKAAAWFVSGGDRFGGVAEVEVGDVMDEQRRNSGYLAGAGKERKKKDS